MLAVISDLHGNLAALEAVRQHIKKLGVSKVYCLGDVVGYGPHPRECIKIVQDFTELCIKGNHEEALLYYSSDFNPQAKIALDWTRDQINDTQQSRKDKFAIWDWIDNLPEVAHTDEVMFVHGSPRDPVREYILPQDIRNRVKMEEVFEKIDRPLCFIGHTHVPGIFTEDMHYLSQKNLEDGFAPEGTKILVNVGAVGQPRDGDPRASFATWDGTTLRFHRVEYDFNLTMNKIMETKVLPKMLALRLREGR